MCVSCGAVHSVIHTVEITKTRKQKLSWYVWLHVPLLHPGPELRGAEVGEVREVEGCVYVGGGELVYIKRLVEIQWHSSLYILLSSSPPFTA